MLLAGRVAVVTGAGRGIGRAIATALATHGAAVALAEIDREAGQATAAALVEAGLETRFVHTDVTSDASVREAMLEIEREYGRIDVLVNNAALVSEAYRRPFDAFDDGDWQRMLEVNLLGAVRCIRAVTPVMRRQGAGSIVNIASASVWYGLPDVAPYLASKGGLVALTRGLARELGPAGIRVNAITPGLIVTERPGPPDDVLPVEAEAVRRRCLPRPELPEDIGGTAVYLASDLSGFVTGQTINVDGGFATH